MSPAADLDMARQPESQLKHWRTFGAECTCVMGAVSWRPEPVTGCVPQLTKPPVRLEEVLGQTQEVSKAPAAQNELIAPPGRGKTEETALNGGDRQNQRYGSPSSRSESHNCSDCGTRAGRLRNFQTETRRLPQIRIRPKVRSARCSEPVGTILCARWRRATPTLASSRRASCLTRCAS